MKMRTRISRKIKTRMPTITSRNMTKGELLIRTEKKMRKETKMRIRMRTGMKMGLKRRIRLKIKTTIRTRTGKKMIR